LGKIFDVLVIVEFKGWDASPEHAPAHNAS
jgi:hypothetical protein